MKTLRIFLVLAIALSLASCGRMKRTIATTETYNKDAQSTEIAETITTIEKVDTVIQTPSDSSERVIPLEQLTDTAVTVIETETQDVELRYDPIAGTIRTKAKVKARQIPVVLERQRVEQRTIDHDSKTVAKVETKDEQVTKTNPLIPFWVWFLAILVTIGYLCFRYVIRRPV